MALIFEGFVAKRMLYFRPYHTSMIEKAQQLTNLVLLGLNDANLKKNCIDVTYVRARYYFKISLFFNVKRALRVT